MRLILLSLLLRMAIPAPATAQALTVPSDSLLDEITERGRLLAAYDYAAWHATDAVLAVQPQLPASTLMVARHEGDGSWSVLFGVLSQARDTFWVSQLATPTARPDSFAVETHVPPLPSVGPTQILATALQTAAADFGRQARPYNGYILPRENGILYVYFLPAQTDLTEFPHGADIRYRISTDGREILAKQPMHLSLLNLAAPDSAVAGLHTVVVDDVPQDSDVFLVLVRRPSESYL